MAFITMLMRAVGPASVVWFLYSSSNILNSAWLIVVSCVLETYGQEGIYDCKSSCVLENV